MTSNQSGEYTVPNLIPDVYDVKADGCRVSDAVENHGIQVSADTSPKVDLKLSVGNATRNRYRHQPKPHSFKPIARTWGLSSTREPFPACPSRVATLPAFNC